MTKPTRRAKKSAARKKTGGKRAPPFKVGNPGGPGRPKGPQGIKAAIRAALEAPVHEGEKPVAVRIAANIRNRALRSADFALRAADYVDPRTNILSGELELSGVEDRLLDALDGLLAESGKANGATAPAGNGATGDAQHDPARSGNGSA